MPKGKFVLCHRISCVAIICFSMPQSFEDLSEDTDVFGGNKQKHDWKLLIGYLNTILWRSKLPKSWTKMKTITCPWLSRIVLTVTTVITLCVVLTIILSPKVPKQIVDIKECLSQRIPIMPEVAQECTKHKYHPGYLEHICKLDQ